MLALGQMWDETAELSVPPRPPGRSTKRQRPVTSSAPAAQQGLRKDPEEVVWRTAELVDTWGDVRVAHSAGEGAPGPPGRAFCMSPTRRSCVRAFYNKPMISHIKCFSELNEPLQQIIKPNQGVVGSATGSRSVRSTGTPGLAMGARVYSCGLSP